MDRERRQIIMKSILRTSYFTEITTPFMGVNLYKLLRSERKRTRQFTGKIWGK